VPALGVTLPSMDAERARAIARLALRDEREPDGRPLLAHVERVAGSVPDRARAVAWLHEILEQTDLPEEVLLDEGLSDEELRALRLLSREGSNSDVVYLSHIELIARADGAAGRLARTVKLADLEDRRRHPRAHRDGWSPPYGSALKVLHRAAPPIASVRDVA
jgi:hypothetical protein